MPAASAAIRASSDDFVELAVTSPHTSPRASKKSSGSTVRRVARPSASEPGRHPRRPWHRTAAVDPPGVELEQAADEDDDQVRRASSWNSLVISRSEVHRGDDDGQGGGHHDRSGRECPLELVQLTQHRFGAGRSSRARSRPGHQEKHRDDSIRLLGCKVVGHRSTSTAMRPRPTAASRCPAPSSARPATIRVMLSIRAGASSASAM